MRRPQRSRAQRHDLTTRFGDRHTRGIARPVQDTAPPAKKQHPAPPRTGRGSRGGATARSFKTASSPNPTDYHDHKNPARSPPAPTFRSKYPVSNPFLKTLTFSGFAPIRELRHRTYLPPSRSARKPFAAFVYHRRKLRARCRHSSLELNETAQNINGNAWP